SPVPAYETPMLRMEEFGIYDSAIVSALIQHGADVNASTVEGQTVLMHAVGYQPVAGIQLLLDSGADANAKDKNGQTVNHYVRGGPDSVQIIRMLDWAASKKLHH